MNVNSAIPEIMHEIRSEDDRGEPIELTLVSSPTPHPTPRQIMIRVRGAGVNFNDILQHKKLYPSPPGAPSTLGMEVAGEVVIVGTECDRWRVGDKVCALLPGGGYAEYAAVDGRHALPIPENVDVNRAAGLPETVITVFANVFENGALKPGETLVVHGATSGIGVTAISMGRALGARVIAVSRGAQKAARALELGADITIDATAESFAQRVASLGGADVILDMVGADHLQQNLDMLRSDGRLCQIAFLTGGKVTLDLSQMTTRRLSLLASSLRTRSDDEKARLTRAVEDRVWPWLRSGLLQVLIDRVFPLERAREAHEYLESGLHTGKVILAPLFEGT
jgi:putative PIG3 family NAD(P)H quinone oxidoreductase